MPDFLPKINIGNLFYSKLMVMLLILLIGLAVVPVMGMYEKYDESRSLVLVDQARRDALAERKEHLGERIDRMASDRGIEAELRGRFSASLAGERMVVLVEDEGYWSDFWSEPEADETWWSKVTEIFDIWGQ